MHTVHTVRLRSDEHEQLSGKDLDSNTGEIASGESQTRMPVETASARVSRKGRPRATVGQSVRAKQAFLESYAQWANITQACKVAGVARNNIYYWQEHDDAFSQAFKVAESAATERLEREAWRRAVEGSPYERTSYWHGEPVGTDRKIEYSDPLLMLLLRARRPDLYREKVDLAVTQVVKAIAGVDPASVL